MVHMSIFTALFTRNNPSKYNRLLEILQVAFMM